MQNPHSSRPSVIVRNPNAPKTLANPNKKYILNINELKRPLSLPHINKNLDTVNYQYKFIHNALSLNEVISLRKWRRYKIDPEHSRVELFLDNLLYIANTLEDMLCDLLNYKDKIADIPTLYALAYRADKLVAFCVIELYKKGHRDTAELSYTISNPKVLIGMPGLSGYGVHLTYETILYIKKNYPCIKKIISHTVSAPSAQIKLDLGFTEATDVDLQQGSSQSALTLSEREITNNSHLYYCG